MWKMHMFSTLMVDFCLWGSQFIRGILAAAYEG